MIKVAKNIRNIISSYVLHVINIMSKKNKIDIFFNWKKIPWNVFFDKVKILNTKQRVMYILVNA